MAILETPRAWPRVLLGRAGAYAPEIGLASGERAGAWAAWKRAVGGMSPQTVLRTVSESGLRGRGGAGFPTGRKWHLVREAETDRRYAVANGYEADPGAALDRTLMEEDPHAVVEGLALAAYAVGATEAFLAIRAEHTVAAARLASVIRGAEEAGYIGTDALGAGFDLHISLRPVQGSFMLGEETVLLRAIEGKRGTPAQRPPYPTASGLWGRPTLVNNVETLAAVPWIVLNGGAAYAAFGATDSPGTTLVQVSGAVREAGLAEVPLGTPVAEILQLAGGPASSAPLKAVMIGGPSGGFLPADRLGLPLEVGSLGEAGAIMGSGTILAIDESACIVDLAALLARFMSDEACGKTIPCRIGVKRLSEIAERFTSGRPRPSDPQLVLDLSADVRDGGLCGHEMTAPNPLLTGMRYFPQEFEDHIVRSTCPAGVCRPLRVAGAAAS